MTTYEWVQGNSAGPHQAPVSKLLLHTTEGGSIEGAIAAYEANNSWPHRTLDSKSKRNCGHLGLNVSARSLRNVSGGVETNTAGVIQIEVVGQAANPAGINWEWVGAELGPICREVGIPVQSSVMWVSYPESYGETAPQRLSASGWLSYVGVLGHQHCPENTHGDPGAIPIELFLDAAQPPTPDLEVPMGDFVLYYPANGTHWFCMNGGANSFAVVIDGNDVAKIQATNKDVMYYSNLTALTTGNIINALNAVPKIDIVEAEAFDAGANG